MRKKNKIGPMIAIVGPTRTMETVAVEHVGTERPSSSRSTARTTTYSILIVTKRPLESSVFKKNERFNMNCLSSRERKKEAEEHEMELELALVSDIEATEMKKTLQGLKNVRVGGRLVSQQRALWVVGRALY